MMIKKTAMLMAALFVVACIAGGCAKNAPSAAEEALETPLTDTAGLSPSAEAQSADSSTVIQQLENTAQTTQAVKTKTAAPEKKIDAKLSAKTETPKSASTAKPKPVPASAKSADTAEQTEAAPKVTGVPTEEDVISALPKATDSPMVTIAPEKVLDINTDTGLLTVRYFLLDSEHKSGDSILIHTPEGKYILIDAGIPESGDQLVGYLKKLGITRIDVLINTHPHQDHLGGMPTVINTFEIGDYYKNPRDYTSKEYSATMAALQARNVPVHVVAEGDTIEFGDGLKFDVYNPPKDMDPYLYSDNGVFTDTTFITQVNQESLALMLTYKDVKCFFCGDLFQSGEGDLIGRYPDGTFDADIVHAPHHGAATSSSTSYLTATDPLLAIMSTNGLQSTAVYEKYTGYGTVVVANSLNGNILITTDGSKESIHSYVEKQLAPEKGQPVPES